MIPTITPRQLKEELDGLNPPIVLDVRELHELEDAPFSYPVVHIPLGQLPERISELDKSCNLVVLCRVGGRSAHATLFLVENGFSRVRNIETGINGWSRSVDPSVKAY